MNRATGLLGRDLLDERDYKLAARAPVPADYKPLERQYANLPFVRSNLDQVEQACVGNGIANAYETNTLRHTGKLVTPSQQDIWTVARLAQTPPGHQLRNEGTFIRAGLDAVARRGVCFRADWPDNRETINIRPPLVAQMRGLRNSGVNYWRLTGGGDPHQLWREICFAIDVFGEVVHGKLIGDRYSYHEGHGVLLPPGKDDVPRGGHCTVYNAYEDAGRVLVERGSWGDTWGYEEEVLSSDGVRRSVQCLGRVDYQWVESDWMLDVWVVVPDSVLSRKAGAE